MRTNPQHCLTLYFPKFLPKSIFLRFIAHYGSQHIDYLYWKNGLLFYGENNVLVHATCDYKERKISIAVQDKNPDTLRKLYGWFEPKLNQNTEISGDEQAFIPIEKLLKNQKFGGVHHEGSNFSCDDFGFLFEDKKVKEAELSVKHDLPKIYDYIQQTYHDSDVSRFCMFYFDEVYRNFGDSQDKQKKLLALFDYCKRNEKIGILLEKLQEDKPEVYEQYQNQFLKS